MSTTTELVERYRGNAPGYPYKYEPEWNRMISYDAFEASLKNAALARDYDGLKTLLHTFTHHGLPGNGYPPSRYQVLNGVLKALPQDEKITDLFNAAKDTLRPFFQAKYDEQPWAFE